MVRPRESNLPPPALHSSALSTELILPRFKTMAVSSLKPLISCVRERSDTRQQKQTRAVMMFMLWFNFWVGILSFQTHCHAIAFQYGDIHRKSLCFCFQKCLAPHKRTPFETALRCSETSSVNWGDYKQKAGGPHSRDESNRGTTDPVPSRIGDLTRVPVPQRLCPSPWKLISGWAANFHSRCWTQCSRSQPQNTCWRWGFRSKIA